MTNARETERVRAISDKTAPRYDRQMEFWDRVLFAGAREWVCSQARGDTLEIAIGSGRNLPHYPPGVRLIGVELSSRMLEIARQRAAELGHDVDLRLGDAEALEFEPESFDTVVCTFGLCTIPNDRKAVSEVRRVLRPGGRFVLAEHVGSPNPVVRAVERALEPLTIRFEADHLTREPLDHVRAEGLVVEDLVRSKWGIVERLVAAKAA